MADITPTEEQTAIVDKAVKDSCHILVEARAGAAKTTTLILIAEALKKKSVLCLAFNASVRDEMKERMPENTISQTIHGCGLNAWRNYLGKPVKIDKKKVYGLLRAQIERLEKPEADEAWENFSETLRMCSDAKTSGVLFDNTSPGYRALMDEATFWATYKIVASELQQQLVREVCKKSWQKCLDGIVDFDDMLLAPAVAGVAFDYYDVVLVDEAQDLAPINHRLLRKIIRGKSRMIAVGDPCQAIYGFRGADEESMKTLCAMFEAKIMYLTTCFRCGQAIVENARWRAPDMRWPDWAGPGLVLRNPEWSADDIPDEAAIICRNNAPLFSLAIRLLRDGRYPELTGRDIIKNLVTKLKKLGRKETNREDSLHLVDAWVKSELLRVRDNRLVEDQADCMRVFITETSTLGDAIDFAEALGQRNGRIYLQTGHRAKGSEFDVVFFLDQHILEKSGQDRNIKYVIETRARDKLIYVSSETYGDVKTVEEMQEESV